MERTTAPALLLALVCACSGDDTNPPLADNDASGGDSSTHDGSTSDGSQVTDGSSAVDAPDSTVPTSGDADATSEASTDADAMPEDSASDAPIDAADAAPALACATWRYATPIVLESLKSAYYFGGTLWVGEPATDQVRVVSQPSDGPAFRVYGFDKTNDTTSTLDGPAIGNAVYESAKRNVSGASGATIVLVEDYSSSDGSDDSELTAYLLPDSLPMTGPIPSAMQVSEGGFGVATFPFANGDLFAGIVSTDVSNPPAVDYALRVGHATSASPATLAQVALSPHVDDFGDLAIAHANGNAYLFATNGAATLGESTWVVPDTGLVSGTPAARAFDTAAESHVIDLGPSAAGGATNFAYYAASASTGSITVRTGQVADGVMDSVTAADLAVARTYADPSLSPVFGSGAEWYGDDLMVIGPGAPMADGGAPAGANLLWLNAQAGVRAEAIGASAVLQSAAGPILAIVAAPASIDATSGRWDVVWVESRSGGDVLLFNELDCQ